MKILIASDIHGSFYYCKKLIENIKKHNPDHVFLLGDLLYHGPRNDLPKDYSPKKVIDLLNSNKEIFSCIRGNCDAEVDQMVLDFPIMADYKTISVENRSFILSHGHIYSKNAPPPHKNGDILLLGHTHIPKFEEFDNFILANPGSVSIPKENSPHSYLIFEKNKFIWYDLENDEKFMEQRF